MQKFALIVAGGTGKRMGSDIPKQFLLLRNKPVIFYTVRAFQETFPDIITILVLPAAHMTTGHDLLETYGLSGKILLVTGGSTRFESVKNGLKQVSGNSVVFVHDGVRCLVSQTLLQRCFEGAMSKGNAVPALSSTDSIRIGTADQNSPADRSTIHSVQTPQTFQSDMLLAAYKQGYRPSFTDEATVAEAAGQRIFLIEGEPANIKITRPIDMLIAEQILNLG